VGEQDERSGMSEFKVGYCVVKPATNEIVRDGEILHLEPKSMEVLVHLIAHRGEVVSRTDLLDRVWPGVLVGDDSLTGAIIKIRRAFADNARESRYVETIPKRGYRLVAPVRETAAAAIEQDVPAASRVSSRLLFTAAAALVLVVAATSTELIWRPDISARPATETRSQSERRIAIAVAPFVNASRDGDQDYLARGIGDSILTDLAREPDFVVRRSSLAGAAGDGSPGFDYLLEGSVLRSRDTIRVESRLVDVETREILDSLRFDRPFVDLLTIEDEIRDTVLDKLAQSISSAEHSREARGYTDNVAAYDLFLRAQGELLIRTRETNLVARALFRRAVGSDLNFARAYGGLALTYAAEYRNGWAGDPLRALDSALKFAGTAISIAPDLPEQYWVVGYVKTQRREYDEARAALQKAIDIDPGFADAYALSGGIETYRGNPAETVPLLREALRLNPEAGYLYFLLLGRAYYFLDDFEQAQINLDEAIARNSENVEAHLYLAATLLRLDRTDDAAWEMEEVNSIEAGFSLDNWSAGYPMARGKQLDHLLADLRAAGFS
jgi:DNA-binding winged helix-turn-helix (wHTH) protein/TolB-like protein/Flp pilus assembly protein TadD